MKKFYQRKGDNQDTLPIVLRLERRHTMETNREEMREQSHLSARALSASSLDKLSVSTTIPRAKTGDVQKSLSCDTQSGEKLKANKIVSETDLSSSWLYKTMQASINARFKSPRKSPSVQQTEDIEPIPLQDPNLKPVPVKSSAEKTSSCLCYFATMIAISICTIGFLASIAGIIYMEVFASRNITSLHASETQVDLSDVALNSLESHNDLTTFGMDAEGHLVAQKIVEGASTGLEKSSVNEGHRGVMGRFLLTGDPDVAELDQYVNSTEAKIKFRDGQTIIYEVNTDEEQSSNSIEDDKSTQQDSFNETKDLSFNQENSSVDDMEVKFEKPEKLSYSKVEYWDDTVVIESMEVSSAKQPDFEENPVEKDLADSKDGKINHEIHSEPEITSLRSNEVDESESAELDTDDFEHEITFNTETTDLLHSNELVDSETMRIDEQSIASNWSDSSNTEEDRGSRAPQNDGITSPFVDHAVESDHDVDSMVMTVDEPEPEEVSTDSFFERNGEVAVSTELSRLSPFSFMSNVSEQSALPKKPVDIKVSLSEAMKHLHVLDTQKKLVTSRKKSTPSKVAWSKRRRATVPPNDHTTTEKMSYLQKVRMMLYRQLQ